MQREYLSGQRQSPQRTFPRRRHLRFQNGHKLQLCVVNRPAGQEPSLPNQLSMQALSQNSHLSLLASSRTLSLSPNRPTSRLKLVSNP